MKERRILWELVKFRPKVFILSVIFASALQLTMQAGGLVTREFFNFLSAGEQARFGLWALVALLIASALAEFDLTDWFDRRPREFPISGDDAHAPEYAGICPQPARCAPDANFARAS